MIQQMLPISSLVLLPSLNSVWTSGIAQYTYCWSLAWRILSITLLVCVSSRWQSRRTYTHLLLWELQNYNSLLNNHRQENVQFSSVSQSCPTLCDPMNCSTPGLPVHHQLPEFTQTHVHQVSDAIQPFILCHPLFLLPPIPPSIRVFSNESTLRMMWPNYWSFSFSIIPSKEIPGLISFRMDWLDLLAVQGTLKSLLQHHTLKASILRRSAFFTVQLTSIHDHWKNHSLD